MTVKLTMKYAASGAVVTMLFPNAVEARRELLRRSQLFEGGSWLRGTGLAGSLVDVCNVERADYNIEEVNPSV